jgi:acid phosphatase type 7
MTNYCFNKPLRTILALAIALVFDLSAHAQSPSVSSAKASYRAGENITIQFTNGPANPLDWIGIYPTNIVPDGDPGSTIWSYVGGTQSAGAGLASGSITFTNGLSTAGEWVAFFLENDGYTILAQTQFTVATIPPPAVVPSVLVEHGMYLPSAPITISFTNGPGNAKDWIGVYPEGVVPDGDPGSTIWNYVDGTQTGNTGATSGSMTFSTGLVSTGKYVAFFLENDGYITLASNAFSVVATDAPFLRLNKRIYQTRENIIAAFTNAPGNATDWVGVYPEGVVPGGPASTIWQYVNGTQTATEAVLAGELTFQNGLNQPGNWVAYLLENDGYTILAQESFRVVAAASNPTPTNNIILPAPLFFEDFNSTAEGSVPAGWTLQSFTDV